MQLASLDELKAHLNLTSSSDDAELWLVLDAAQDVVRSATGVWGGETVTESVPVIGGTAVLSKRPTGDVLIGGLPIGGRVDRAAGIVTDIGGYYATSVQYRLTVTYPTGSDSVPGAVRLATLIIAAHLWETQRGAQPLPLQGADEATVSTGYAPAIPSRAAALLEPYSRKPQVA